MTFLEALKEAKKGKKVRNNCWIHDTFLTIKNGKIKMDNVSDEYLSANDRSSDKWEVIKNTILNDKEKDYIRTAVKFFNNMVIGIRLEELCHNFKVLRFDIYYKEMDFKDFKYSPYIRGEMFKNLEQNRTYTLEELGIDD